MRTVALAVWLTLSSVANANPNDTSNDDCDNDGVTEVDGDCNDQNPDISPDEEERCGNNIDDNCNDVIDENCDGDNPLAGATLVGGTTCGGGGAAWLILFPVLGAGRRRRTS